jgi:hypothetical protein
MLRIRNYLSLIELVKRSSKRFSIVNYKDKNKNPQDDHSYMLNPSHHFLNENFNENFKPLDQKQNPSIMDQIDYNIHSTDNLLFPPDNYSLNEKAEVCMEDNPNVNESNFKSKIST